MSTKCGNPKENDHCVTAVGYDLVEGYVTIKNSWNSDWGEEGYIRIAVNSDEPVVGYCLIFSEPYRAEYIE